MLVGKLVFDEEKIGLLIEAIKNKKELREISTGFVRDELFTYLQKHPRQAQGLYLHFHHKSSSYKTTIKDIRVILRRSYGLFRIDDQVQQRHELVEALITSSPEQQTKLLAEILSTHSSTKERLSFYGQMYIQLFRITGKPKTVIDLGCGLNPFSVSYMGLKPQKLRYCAYDISEEEIASLQEYFSFLSTIDSQFEGTAQVLDTQHWSELKQLPPADICFLLKMTDVLDRGKGHKVSEYVITNVPAKYVVVSFSTKTMSGKQMRAPERKWLQWMCRRLKYHSTTLKFSNEIFYVIKK